jgi:tetratricopeptide (TPR) repeat protein
VPELPVTRWRSANSATAIALGLGLATPAVAWALPRTAADASEVDTLRSRSPRAAALLEQGEALAVSGALEPADALFKQAEGEYPDSAIVWRRDCEALTALGRRDDALMACNRATTNARAPVNFRATMRALVRGPTPPRPMDLFAALTLTEDRLQRSGRVDPILAGTACDIAESLGDAAMLQQCLSDLEAVAPADPMTTRARELLAACCSPWRFWLGWGTIIALGVATLGHAVARASRRRRGPVAAAIAGIFLAWSLLAHEGVARAETDVPPASSATAAKGLLSDYPVDDDDPSKSIPSAKQRDANPLQFGYWIQDLIMKAEHASKRGHHLQAARYWEALSVAVPDRAVSFARLCDEYEAVDEYDKAMEACGQALLRDGLTVQDYIHFVNVVLAKPGPVDAAHAAALGQVLDHMKSEDASRNVANELECEVGVRTSNLAQLKECTAALDAAAPDDPKTISFRWALALQENKFRDATKLIEAAKAKGMRSEGIANMERTTADVARRYWKRVFLWAFCVALLFGGVGVAAKVLGDRRRATQPA